MVVVRFDHFSYLYEGAVKNALSDINLTIKPGEFVMLVGSGGSGKSTLLHTINGIIPGFIKGTMNGEVIVDGKNTKSVLPLELTKLVGVVFQNAEMQFFTTTVEEELALALENVGVPKEIILERISWALNIIDMEDYRTRPLYALSGGQKQLIAIASILVMQPKILLLDEPTANLDTAGSKKVYRVIEEIRKKTGVTVILIDHKIDMILDAVGDDLRIIGLKEGKIIADGLAREILSDIVLVNNIGLKPLDTVILYHSFKSKGIDIGFFITEKEAIHQISDYLEKGVQR